MANTKPDRLSTARKTYYAACAAENEAWLATTAKTITWERYTETRRALEASRLEFDNAQMAAAAADGHGCP